MRFLQRISLQADDPLQNRCGNSVDRYRIVMPDDPVCWNFSGFQICLQAPRQPVTTGPVSLRKRELEQILPDSNVFIQAPEYSLATCTTGQRMKTFAPSRQSTGCLQETGGLTCFRFLNLAEAL
jgi:hypothetical protein